MKHCPMFTEKIKSGNFYFQYVGISEDMKSNRVWKYGFSVNQVCILLFEY